MQVNSEQDADYADKLVQIKQEQERYRSMLKNQHTAILDGLNSTPLSAKQSKGNNINHLKPKDAQIGLVSARNAKSSLTEAGKNTFTARSKSIVPPTLAEQNLQNDAKKAHKGSKSPDNPKTGKVKKAQSPREIDNNDDLKSEGFINLDETLTP